MRQLRILRKEQTIHIGRQSHLVVKQTQIIGHPTKDHIGLAYCQPVPKESIFVKILFCLAQREPQNLANRHQQGHRHRAHHVQVRPSRLAQDLGRRDDTHPKGKVTAIVGALGSGKTTLVKLMLGYYPVLEGQVNIGGTDINTLNKKWWRRQCGVVMQDGVIFSESIARNIAVDDGDIDKERLLKAAQIACIHDYVMSLPLKYNTKIGRDGVGLSQGQRQRILIARAVYKNPDYIFLDEATNSLDANNERTIVENLDMFYRGKTVVIVAHRLSTVRNADQIVVIDHEKVVETGNHETLTAKRGANYNLVKNKLELGN